MTDYSNAIAQVDNAAPTLAVTSLGENPDDGARALQLASATGAAPQVVHADLDGFEKQHRQNLTAYLVKNNSQISSYIRGNPLADVVSNDDYGNLDKFSKSVPDTSFASIARIAFKGAAGTVEGAATVPYQEMQIGIPAVVEGVKGAFTGAKEAVTAPRSAEEIEAFQKAGFAGRVGMQVADIGVRTMNAIAGATFGGAGEFAGQIAKSLGADESGVERAKRDAQTLVESEMGRGGENLEHLEANVEQRKFRQSAEEAVVAAKPWMDAGVQVPRGVHPFIDETMAKVNSHYLDVLEQNLADAQASLTKDRSSDLFQKFAEQHYEDSSIGISGDRVVQLYGDRLPEPDDGLLGWVPGIEDKLAAAKETGEDVHVPLKHWMAQVDPAVAKELRPDTRVFPGGITENEAKEPWEPRPVVDAALPKARDATGTEPLFAVGDRKMELRKVASLPGFEEFHEFQFHDQNGKPVGELTIVPQTTADGVRELYVANINGLAGLYSNAFGPALVRDLKRQLKEIYPDAEYVTGHRVSGAREAAGSWQEASAFPKVKLALGEPESLESHQAFKDVMENAYRRHFGYGVEANLEPSELLKPRVREVAQAMVEEGRRIAGGNVDILPVSDISWANQGLHDIEGTYLQNPGRVPLILANLFSNNPIGYTRHEAIHHLYRQGLFAPEEWNALVNSAKGEGWISRYGIDRLYGDLDERGQIEESIAEAYRDWAAGRDEVEQPQTLVTQAFEKMKAFWENVQTRLKEIFGRELSPEELFKRIESGKVGERDGTGRPTEPGIAPRAARFSIETTEHENDAVTFRPAGMEQWDRLSENGLGMIKKDNAYRIVMSHIPEEFREKGFGISLYEAAAQYANERGFPLQSDSSVSSSAARMYETLASKDYDVIKNPEAKLDDKNKLVTSNDEPVFTVKKKDQTGVAPRAALSPENMQAKLNNLRANAAGLDSKTFEKIQKLVQGRYEEDIKASLARAEKEQKTIQTKEWKDQAKEIGKQVEETIRNRPDVMADLLVGSGEVAGKKLRQVYPLRSEDLTAEQKQALPRRYYSADGLPADATAKMLGFTSGEDMVNSLVKLHADTGEMSAQERLRKVIDDETDRQMQAKFGDLQKNIITEAQDQALSENNLNILAEEWQGAAMQAGVSVVDKNVAKAEALRVFSGLRIGDVDSSRLLTQMSKHYRDATNALIAGKPAEALVSLQRRYEVGILAAEAKRLEKERAGFDRVAKQFAKREVPSVDSEYTNYIHGILMQVGKPVRRSVQDLQTQIAAGESKSLEEFVGNKQASLREVPVWDQLYDSNWRKKTEDLTVEEFRNVNNSVKTLVHNGRDEMKIYRQGEAADFAEVKQGLIENIADSVKGEVRAPRKPGLVKSYYVKHLQMENVFNRWDAFDAKGLWNQYIMRDLVDGANQVDAWKKEYAGRIKELKSPKDLGKVLDNPIFKDQDTGTEIPFTRKNLITVMLNTGTQSNLVKMAKGYKIEPAEMMSWIHQHATVEDWKFVQGIWDIFKEIKTKSDTMYRSLTGGVPAENIPVTPVQTPHGMFAGGYYPIIFHSEMEGKSKKLMGKDPLEQENFVRATTPAGYTKSRTGYVAPLALDLDQMPGRISQMLHDIGLRPAVLNAAKVFYDPEVRSTVRKYYGDEYKQEMIPYLQAIANSSNRMEKSQQAFTRASEFIRQNVITTLVGLNPGTVLKHGPSALVTSIREVGPVEFAKAVTGLMRVNEETGERNWQFAIKNSLELQRRDRNWEETLYGATGGLNPGDKFPAWRQRIMEWSSKPVAISDMLSAVPTWLAAYEKEMGVSGIHGDAVFAADRAVRRAHGSTAITGRTAIQREAPSWLTSVYNYFSDIMNRQMETIWKAGDTLDLVKSGQKAAAMATVPAMTASLFAYAVWPAMVENLVSPSEDDPKDSWGKKVAKQALFTASSSWVGVRDVVTALEHGKDPQYGLTGTAMQEISNVVRDLNKEHPFAREHAGKLIQDGASFIGAVTGVVPAQIGKAGRFVHDVSVGKEHPKTAWAWATGLRFGTTKGHSTSVENYVKGVSR